jgi:hypothetical protein
MGCAGIREKQIRVGKGKCNGIEANASDGEVEKKGM